MNEREVAEFEAAVAAFLEREGLNCLNRDGNREVEFAYWNPWQCDCCGRDATGGDKIPASGFNPEHHEIKDGYDVCRECLFYVSYGEVPL